MTESTQSPTWHLFDPPFIGDVADPDRSSSPWSGHRYFAYDLVRWQQPSRIVELGTHWGCSFFALAQAVGESGLDTECHAVDTWKGDLHAGFYGSEVYEAFTRIVHTHFSNLDVRIHRKTFDEALDIFEDGSIDLLHIVGYHTFDAVRHDFETWLPKVADNGIVLFHDTDPSSGYGSADYWNELRLSYPGFGFPHSFGLGVLFPRGTEGLDYLLTEEFMRWCSYYTEKAGNTLGRIRYGDQTQLIDQRDQTIADQTQLIDEQRQAMEHLTNEIALIRSEHITSGSLYRSFKGWLKRTVKRMPEPIPTWALGLRRRWWQFKARAEPSFQSPVSVEAGDQTDSENRESQDGPGLKEDPTLEEADPATHPAFDETFYRAFNSDIEFSSISPIDHYLNQGLAQGRPANRYGLGKSLITFNTSPELVTKISPTFRLFGREEKPQIINSLNEIPDSEFDLITVDLWDTLLTRERPAESVKLDTSRFLARHQELASLGILGRTIYEARLQAESRIAAERSDDAGWGEYTANEVLMEALSSLVPDLARSTISDLVTAAIEHEAHQEAIYGRPNHSMRAWLRTQAQSGKHVAIVTDFYHDRTTLSKILESVDALDADIPLFVSCELGQSKASGGRLLETARRHFDVPANRHLHIGDNQHSDVESQTATGGTALHVAPTTPRMKQGRLGPQELSEMFLESLARRPDPVRTRKIEDVLRWPDMHQYRIARSFNAGLRLSLLPSLLVLAAIEMARKLGRDRVFYLSREGALLTEIHRAISDLVGAENVVPVYLSVSRRSTFGPSLQDLDKDLERMWSFYNRQSPNEFLLALGADTERYRKRLLAHGLDPDNRVWHLGENPTFLGFMQQRSVRKELEEALSVRRERLLETLAPLGEATSQVLVDIGWRGTIQDNISLLFPDTTFHGIYLGLLAFLNPQPPNTCKSAIGPDGNLNDDVSWLEDYVGVVERLFTPSFDSVEQGTNQTRQVRAERDSLSSAYLNSFQDGVLAGATTVADMYSMLGCEVADLKPAAFQGLRSLIMAPPSGVADAFFAVSHFDDFGSRGPDTRRALSVAVERLREAIAMGSGPPTLSDLYWPAGLHRSHVVATGISCWW